MLRKIRTIIAIMKEYVRGVVAEEIEQLDVYYKQWA